MFLETCLSILNVAEKATRIYDWFTGVSAGEKKNSNVDSLAKNKSQIVRLSDRVLYAPSFHQVSSNEQARALNDNKKIYDLLDPMAQALETEVLASAVISTPEKLRSAFNKDPWEVLLDIRPVERTKKSSNPDLIPISFHDNNLQYIGWQTRGALPILFNCQFESNGNIWAPTPKVQKLNSRPKEVPISS